MLSVGFEELGHPLDPATPDLFEVVERSPCLGERLGRGLDELLAATPALRDEPGALEDETCFCTAANDIGYASASLETDDASIPARRRMSRRVESASAWKTSSVLLFVSTTIWL